MTALVASALSALHLDAPPPLPRYLGAKRVVSEQEQKKLIFDTPYEPSLSWWNENQAEYRKAAPAQSTLPAGFPQQVDGANVWDGKVLINQPEKWVYHFTAEDILLIETAHEHFSSLNLPNNDISRGTFPIPADSALYAAFQSTVKAINHGLGFQVLRGLPVDEWSRAKQIQIFAGISAYIGTRRIKQGVQNVVHLRDITNVEIDKRPAITVKGQTAGNQVFHNDGSVGIVGLITLGVPHTGGLSQLSSVGATYNELASSRPDIIRELSRADWVSKAYPLGQPLIFTIGGKVISCYARRPFFGFYEADPDVPTLKREKHLALDAVHFTAEKYSLDIELQKGDLEFFNNLTVYHGRTASKDSETNIRHLVRVHLENPEQPLPESVRKQYEKSNAGTPTEWPQEAWDSVDQTGQVVLQDLKGDQK